MPPSDDDDFRDRLTWKDNDRERHELAGNRPHPTLNNAVTIMTCHPWWRGLLGWDAFAIRPIFLRPPKWSADDAPSVAQQAGDAWTGTDDSRAVCWFGRNMGATFAKRVIEDAVAVVAKRNTVHPLRAFLGSLRWDGKERIRRWLPDYLGADDNASTRRYLEAIGPWWLVSAIARAFDPGCQADHALILEGGQGAGKSTALRTLGAPWFSDTLDDLGGKESYIQIQGVWIVEIAELDSFSKARDTSAKRFITTRSDRFRAPYEKVAEDHGRQCAFAGSVNEEAYLRDDTGNRRYWPVKCRRIRLDELARDREQLLAEAIATYMSAHPTLPREWWPDDPSLRDLLAAEQSARMVADVWEDAVEAALRGDSMVLRQKIENRKSPPPRGQGFAWLSTGDVLEALGAADKWRWTRADQMRAGSVLTRLGWSRAKRYIGGDERRTQWIYVEPIERPPRDIYDEEERTAIALN